MSIKICNFTQHAPTPEQVEQGVYNPTDEVWTEVKRLLTFDTLESAQREKKQRAYAIAQIALGQVGRNGTVLIGGAPFFMSSLEYALLDAEVNFLYAFSERRVVEEINKQDGSVKKVNVFRHKGFV